MGQPNVMSAAVLNPVLLNAGDFHTVLFSLPCLQTQEEEQGGMQG